MPRPLGELEDAVMTRVWRWNRPVTVREVLEDLESERTIAYTTVMTVMDNLHQKGWVRRHQQGRAYRYEPISTRAAYSAALMKEAWSASDNPAAALVDFFGMMSPEQVGVLRDALRVVQLNGVRVDEPREDPSSAEPAERPSRTQLPSEGSESDLPETGTSRSSPAPRSSEPPASGTGGSER
nr:BlaI/MecI/CopY family transcriptional regulator [Streptomyces sulphureus]